MRLLRKLRPKPAEDGALGKETSEVFAKLGKANRRNRAQEPVQPVGMPPMEKVIVFSQWTTMLDLLEPVLRKERFTFRRLDGTMSLSARQWAVQDFTMDPEVSVMLVSLKAASLGVNLVSANHVVLMDLWYNPATEDQAIDRAHRIGQTKAVNVSRIVIQDTVEDKILELQKKKQNLMDQALKIDGDEDDDADGSKKSKGRAAPSAEDLRFLFDL
jgi:SNF2 family DNA or RNA helicase